jgi:pimeloyl-ACP methyl ester carboxylesterase
MGIIRSISRGVALFGGVVAGGALAVTASSVLATPQPLENALEGEGRIFRFRTGDVFYTVAGPADAPPILLLHSVHLSASSYEWRQNFRALSQGFRVYAPDLLGFGLSDRPALDYTPEVYVDLVSDFAREVIARPATVVARNHSAPFVVRAAALEGRLFSRLVLISPAGILPTMAAEERDWPARSSGALQGIWRRIGASTAGQVPYAVLTTKPALSWLVARQSYAHPEQVTPDVVEHLFATTHQFGARYAPLAFMSGKLDLDVSGNFAALRQPILLVWGEEDAINDPMHAEALGRLNPHTRLELLAQAGNAVQEEQAEEVNDLLRAWCMAPTELVDPTLREQDRIFAAAPFASDVQVTPPAPTTTAAPLTMPITETPQEAAEEETPASYVEAPSDETEPVAAPPAANPGAPPEAFATEDTRITSASAEEAATEVPEPEAAPEPRAAQPPKKATPRRAPSGSTGTRASSSQTRQSKAGQHESARQARSDAADKPPSSRSSQGPKKKS